MIQLIYRTLYFFFVMLEFILTAYILLSLLPNGSKVREFMRNLVAPILNPIRFLMKHSILFSHVADLSPLIAFVVVSYLQHFFYIQLR